MQAIITKFLGATNYRPARVSARCQAKRIIVSWDHALDVDDNHYKAAAMLAEQLGWDAYGPLVGGGLPDGTGNAYVIQPKGTP